MSYNFPISPAAGTLYAPAGGPSWRFLDGAWQSVGSAEGVEEAPVDGVVYGREDGDWTALGTAATKNIHVGTSPPASPAPGDIWIDTT